MNIVGKLDPSESYNRDVRSEIEELKNAPKDASKVGRAASMHIIPCEDCGRKDWQDWTLLPHELFNETCTGGNGYLCFPCFMKRTHSIKQLLDRVRQDELKQLTDFLKKAHLYDQDTAMKLRYHLDGRIEALKASKEERNK